jgi:hypothetical protein
VLVVPRRVETQLTPHRLKLQRNPNVPRTLGFHRTYEPLDDGDTSLLAHSTEPRTDGPAATPLFEGIAPKLPPLIGDDILGWAGSAPDRSVEKSLYVARCRTIMENSESNYGTGKVIDHNGDPPTEGPRLRQGKRNPRNPETRSRWHGGEIDMPNITRTLGRDNSRFDNIKRCCLLRYWFCIPQHPSHRGHTEV